MADFDWNWPEVIDRDLIENASPSTSSTPAATSS